MWDVIPTSSFALNNQIAFNDLGFRKVAISAKSTRGTPYTRSVPIGMPRIPPKFLDSVCYMYENEERAIKGEEFGGTGFFVLVPSRISTIGFVYVVTNHHVACRYGYSVVRVNTLDGGTDVFPLEPHEWIFDPHYDIAVCPIGLRNERHKFTPIMADQLVTREEIERLKIGPGEGIFMIGRFVDHDGGPINRPAVRFGNISVMPSPIEQPTGYRADAYCVDMHSRSGYSGSPVFIYRTSGYDLDPPRATDISSAVDVLLGGHFFGLLGIHFAQFSEQWEIQAGITKYKKEASTVPLISEGGYVKGLSGMTCVLPSWYILEVINLQATVRAEVEMVIEYELRQKGLLPPTPEAS